MRRTLLGILAALTLLASTACTVTQKDPDYVPPAPLPPWSSSGRRPLTDAAKYAAGEDILSFVTADRNVVCSLTSASGRHVNLPYEPNGFADSANNKLATVPVAHCELAVYPKPAAHGHHGRLRRNGPGLPRRRRAAHPGDGRLRRMPLRRHTAGSRIRAQGQPQRARSPSCPSSTTARTWNATACAARPTTAVSPAETSPPASPSSSSRDHYELISGAGKQASQAPSTAPKTP